MSKTAPFLPLDCVSYNLNNRPKPLVNTQGHVAEEAAKMVHGVFQTVLGTDQSEFSSLLKVDDKTESEPPYLAVSDWYSNFVRSGLIALSKGKIEGLDGSTANLSDGTQIKDIAAVVVATGFDPSPCLSFLSSDVLKTLRHSPKDLDQPVALAFHGTHHPDVARLGFVGFYRSPYWGVMQMQARFLARLWSSSRNQDQPSPEEKQMREAFQEKLQSDGSIQRTLDLRIDPRTSQFPMGDYPFLLQEFSEALSENIISSTNTSPNLPHNNLPLDMLTPARYPARNDDENSRQEAKLLLDSTQRVILDGLTTPRFVAGAVFRSLLGTWKLERDLKSKLPTHPSGHFSGTAQFLLRQKTSDGLRCATNGTVASLPDESGMEYLYIEEGEFKTDQGFGFRATRRYIWRYDELQDVLSVWFAKPDDLRRADYLFHEIEFLSPEQSGDDGWKAKAGHLCIDDYYDVKYNFAFQAVNLKEWCIEYTVKGPKKDYTISGRYTR